MGTMANQFTKTVLGGRVKLEVVYGSTEAGMLSCFNSDQTYDTVRAGECGRIYDGVEIKVRAVQDKTKPTRSHKN